MVKQKPPNGPSGDSTRRHHYLAYYHRVGPPSPDSIFALKYQLSKHVIAPDSTPVLPYPMHLILIHPLYMYFKI